MSPNYVPMGVDAPEVADMHRFFNGQMRPAVAVETLANYHNMHPVRVIPRGGEPRPMRAHAQSCPSIKFEQDGRRFDLYDYLATNRVAGLLILKDGAVVLENYELGVRPDTLWASCSIAKSIASTLAGAAVLDGAITSLDEPASRYVAALKDGAYDDVSVRQILMMVSAVQWDETYTNSQSERRKLLEKQLTHRSGAIVEHMSRLRKAGPPGSAWKYNTGESYLLGAIVESAVGQNLADYLSEKIWAPAGMDRDATWWVEGAEGMAVAGSGMSATLRDYGRFGQFVVDGGRLDGAQVVPEGWFAQAGASGVIDGVKTGYGFMWWIPLHPDPILAGSFQAEGIYGQYIHVNPRERLVVVVLSARSKPSSLSRVEFDDDAFFAGVAKALR